MKKFLDDNKVFLLGLLASIGVVLQQFTSPEVDYKIVLMAVIGAVGSYFAKNIRGQWASIAGIAGNLLAVIVTQWQNHQPISWQQMILQLIIGFIAVVAPPAKPVA